MRFKVTVDSAQTEQALTESRKEVFAGLKTGLVSAGERVVLPSAKGLAPHKTGALANSLVVKASATGGRGGVYGIRSAYLTTSLRGKKGRFVGLQEFGGTIRARLRPRKAKALFFNGRFVAEVTAPRTIKGKHFLSNAAQRHVPEIEAAIEREVMKAFAGFGG